LHQVGVFIYRYQCVEEAAGSVFYANNPEDTYPESLWVKHAGRK
jgi:hypothetical protein